MKKYNGTKLACYIGYFVQAILINLSPLLFVIYNDKFGLSYLDLSWLISIAFLSQLVVDIIAINVVDKVGYRASLVTSHIFSFVGLVLLGVLPSVMDNTFIALVIATVIASSGSGLIEVLINPVMESIPSDSKEGNLSFLHSFYSWGQVVVIIFTTLLLRIIGADIWFVIPILWSIIPLINLFNFIRVPLVKKTEEQMAFKTSNLFASKFFYFAILLMICAGASEMIISQWSSLFVERSLYVPKVVGDLLGPCIFATSMGIGRMTHILVAKKINTKKVLGIYAGSAVIGYLLISLSQHSILTMFGFAVCGLSVSVFWPGVISLTSNVYSSGNTAMYAVLALAGDIGCMIGPYFAGLVTTIVEDASHIDIEPLRIGILSGIIFPLIMVVGIIVSSKIIVKKK